MPFQVGRSNAEQRVIGGLLYDFPLAAPFLGFKDSFPNKLSFFDRDIVKIELSHAPIAVKQTGKLILFQIIEASRFPARDSEERNHFTFIRIRVARRVRMGWISVEPQHFLISVPVKIVKREGRFFIDSLAFIITFGAVIIPSIRREVVVN